MITHRRCSCKMMCINWIWLGFWGAWRLRVMEIKTKWYSQHKRSRVSSHFIHCSHLKANIWGDVHCSPKTVTTLLIIVCARSCLSLCDPVDYSPPGYSMGLSRQEYWSGKPFPPPGEEGSWPRDRTNLCLLRLQILYYLGSSVTQLLVVVLSCLVVS